MFYLLKCDVGRPKRKLFGGLEMVSVDEVVRELKAKAKPDQVKGMARYGMTAEQRLGVSIPDIRKIAKEVGKDHQLALGLWETEIPEARIVAAMVDLPEELTEEQMEKWVVGLNSWDVCDQVCMNLFEKSSLAWKKIIDWSKRDEEYVKRTAYALIACLAWHNKSEADNTFIELFPVIKQGATDERNYVKKAVSWALRNIGKRNKNLNRAVVEVAKEIRQMDSKTARWIASGAIKELESEAVQRRLDK